MICCKLFAHICQISFLFFKDITCLRIFNRLKHFEIFSTFVFISAVYARMRSQLRLLDYFIGPKGPRVDIRQFVNWDKTIIIDHLFYVKPKTIWEVQRVVNAAALTGIHIRATGGGHTRSPLYPDEGQISMDVRELERHDGPRIELHKPVNIMYLIYL